MGPRRPDASAPKLWGMPVATLVCETLSPMPKPPDPEVEAGEARLRAAVRAKKSADKLAEQRLEDLAQQIVTEFQTGKFKAAHIARVVGYTPDHVRRILRAHGIEGDPTRLTPPQRAALRESEES